MTIHHRAPAELVAVLATLLVAAPLAPAVAAPEVDTSYVAVAAELAAAARTPEQEVAAAIEAGLTGIDARDRAGLATFYAGREHRPLWIEDGRPTDAARAVVDRLRRAGEDGLDPADYAVPSLTALDTPAARADAELRLSAAAVAYARDAQIGRVAPKSISANFGYELTPPAPASVMAALAEATDAGDALAAYNPPHEAYVRLREKLATAARDAEQASAELIPEGALLKPGMTDPRVPALRERLRLPASGAESFEAMELYDASLVEAIKAFQRSNDLAADGIVGQATLTILNGPAIDRTAEILANMERWRWLPRDFGRFYVQVNVPAFTVEVHKDDKLIHETRVVVGTPQNQTPVFSDEIDHIIVNPYWHVPDSIAVKEMMPEIQNDPNFFARKDFEVLANIGGKFQRVNPWQVDWDRVNPRAIKFRQPPGEANALGSIKFMFPNKYSVYLHDTPSKRLFQRDFRAYSHGCVRVMDPFAFAEALLSEDDEWNAARLRKMVGGREARLNLSTKVPVHLTYFTAWVDDAGTLQVRKDIYGHNQRVQKALGL